MFYKLRFKILKFKNNSLLEENNQLKILLKNR